MKDVVVIGAGKIGATVAGLLATTGDYQVTLADRSPEVLGNLDRDERIRIMAADVEDSLKLVDLLNGQFAIINAAPFRLTKHVAEAARAAACERIEVRRRPTVRRMIVYDHYFRRGGPKTWRNGTSSWSRQPP
ncbi:MAG: saccharopine dehydrogenase NADP-binding domain-containing protein [Xanthobacteraceae bacterium]